MKVSKQLFALQDALAFLTCLVPCHTKSKDFLANSLAYFLPASLLIGVGLLLTSQALVYCVSSTLDALLRAALQAFTWLCLEVLLTRAIHLDGLADLSDGLGSAKMGQEFFTILHDSTIGSFGAIALILVLLGQWICLAAHFWANNWLVIILAPAFARQAPMWLALLPAHATSKLGSLFCEALVEKRHLTTIAKLVLYSPLCLAIYYQNFSLLCLVVSQLLINLKMKNLINKYGGLSGDFLGAAIELTQLNFLFFTL